MARYALKPPAAGYLVVPTGKGRGYEVLKEVAPKRFETVQHKPFTKRAEAVAWTYELGYNDLAEARASA